MKKIFAMICALTLSCACFAGCADKTSGDSSSTSSSTSSVAEESVSGEESAAEQSASDTTFARAYTDMLENKDFKVTMVTSSDMMPDTTTMVEVSGSNYHMSIGENEDKIELFIIEGVMYMLSHADKTYIIDETPDEKYLALDIHSYTMGVEDSYKFIGTETTADGLICETYYAPDLFTGEMPTSDEESDYTVYKYYFEQSGTTPVRIEMAAYGLSQSTTFSEFEYDVPSLEVPDLTGWNDKSGET